MAASSPSKKPPGECTEPTMFLEKLYEVRASSRRLLLPKHCATQPAARRAVLSSVKIFAACADFPERGIYSASMPRWPPCGKSFHALFQVET